MPIRRKLEDLGWNAAHAEAFRPFAAQGWVPARLIRDNKITLGAIIVQDRAFEELEVVTSGRVYHEAKTDAELPAVGDWVALELGGEQEDTVIRARLPRQTCLSRKAPGNSTQEQVIAANVDTVIVVTEPGADFNLRRMERYFEVIHRSRAQAVVLLNKADLFTQEECDSACSEIKAIHPSAAVHVISVKLMRGLTVLRQYLKPGATVAFIGSSGVGKSALINHLLGGDYQETGEVNEVTHKGRHTTTARELMVLRKGGIIVDNPGIKEVQMWTDEGTLRERFADIALLAESCRFHDCKHGSDEGCAIRHAVETGSLDEARYAGYLRLEEEVAELQRNMKKRQMTVERIQKRQQRDILRNKSDRREHRRQQRPDWQRDDLD
jgi:ribosome biogenesis GTPase / thiamine phosphate phosphatase